MSAIVIADSNLSVNNCGLNEWSIPLLLPPNTRGGKKSPANLILKTGSQVLMEIGTYGNICLHQCKSWKTLSHEHLAEEPLTTKVQNPRVIVVDDWHSSFHFFQEFLLHHDVAWSSVPLPERVEACPERGHVENLSPHVWWEKPHPRWATYLLSWGWLVWGQLARVHGLHLQPG